MVLQGNQTPSGQPNQPGQSPPPNQSGHQAGHVCSDDLLHDLGHAVNHVNISLALLSKVYLDNQAFFDGDKAAGDTLNYTATELEKLETKLNKYASRAPKKLKLSEFNKLFSLVISIIIDFTLIYNYLKGIQGSPAAVLSIPDTFEAQYNVVEVRRILRIRARKLGFRTTNVGVT